jgi:ABC-type uncharacterized transport system auxiliary subunit
MKNLKILLVLLVLVPLMNSCIDIKSDYPDIKYYSLNFYADSISSKKTIEGSLLIRGFAISNEYDTDYLLVNTENKVKRFFYHRWFKNFNQIATDYTIKAFTEKKVFDGGVYTVSTYVSADYILEGYVMEVKNVFDKEKDTNYTQLKIKFNMIKIESRTTEPLELFNEVFTSTVTMPDDRIKYVPKAVETAITDITNQLIKKIEDVAK